MVVKGKRHRVGSCPPLPLPVRVTARHHMTSDRSRGAVFRFSLKEEPTNDDI